MLVAQASRTLLGSTIGLNELHHAWCDGRHTNDNLARHLQIQWYVVLMLLDLNSCFSHVFSPWQLFFQRLSASLFVFCYCETPLW